MAFKFTWPAFSPSFYETASQLLTSALSKAPMPPIITDNIVVKEFNLGTTPPDLEMLEIGELGEDKFRGVFKLKYSGDAYIVLQTKVQANPLNTRSRLTPSFTSRGVLAADTPLIVPMFLRLSSFHLSGIIILVFSKQKGLTLVFRNDPIESLNVSSTFDSIPSIQRFLQAEIERLLRDLMQEQVPAIIHKLSLEWAMRHQADECLSPASLTNTLQSEEQASPVSYPFSLDVDETDDVLRPKFSSVSLARLGELEGAQRTLSPFTAAIPQSVFRSSAGLIAALRPPRRRDFPFIKSSIDTESATFQRPTEISPPESVLSAQSNVSRPSLFNTRQRPSYLRRPRHPKRKVIRLGASSPSTSAQDHESGQSETSEGGADYFSEPDGYQNSYQRECESKWMKEAVLREALWSGTYPKVWEGMANNHLEKGGEQPWTGDSRFTGSRDKGGL